MKSKYKKGDIIRIKPIEYFKNHPNYSEREETVQKGSCFVIEIMKSFCEKEYEIIDITYIESRFVYKLRNFHLNLLIPLNFDEWMFNDMVKEKIKML